MTPNEANIVIKQAAADQAFRQRLLREPQNAVSELNITFSDDEIDSLLCRADDVRNKCIAFDRIRDQDRRALMIVKVASVKK